MRMQVQSAAEIYAPRITDPFDHLLLGHGGASVGDFQAGQCAVVSHITGVKMRVTQVPLHLLASRKKCSQQPAPGSSQADRAEIDCSHACFQNDQRLQLVRA
jgi:hypothetical protein